MARPNDTRMPGKLKVSAVEARLSPFVGEILWLVERSGGCDGAWGSGALTGGEGEILGRSICCGGSANLEYVSLFGRRKNGVCDHGKGASREIMEIRLLDYL